MRTLDGTQDADYPRGLADLSAPPALDLDGEPIPAGPRVAIVGSRRAAPAAESFAHHLARDLAIGGVSVVSGGAFGIDAAAHQGALDGGGRTWVVLAGDVRAPGPTAHRPLFDRIVKSGGGLVAESGRSRAPYELVRRNRIVAALADVLVIVQGTRASGTRHTLAYARDLERPVGAVPWCPWDERGAIPHQALRHGAFAVTSSDDVARRLGLPTIAETSPKSPLETALRAGPQTLDELVASTGCRPAELRAKLGELELEGRVRRRAGRYEA